MNDLATDSTSIKTTRIVTHHLGCETHEMQKEENFERIKPTDNHIKYLQFTSQIWLRDLCHYKLSFQTTQRTYRK